MKVPKEARKLSRALFRSSLTAGRLDSAKVSAMLDQTLAAKPRHYISALKSYQRLVRLELGKRHAVIESATPLAPAVGQEIVNSLRASHGTDITTEFKVNPELIGGVSVRLGSDLWDGSIRGRLNALQSTL
ncbi:MAG: F0F1 ATP synthase subunit delta [Verrucomicrobiota bacterium]